MFFFKFLNFHKKDELYILFNKFNFLNYIKFISKNF